MNDAAAALFPPELLAAAGLLPLAPEPAGLAFSAGRHRSRRCGASVEFQDFRAYAPGDDLRRLDWNIYRRFRKFVVRQYRDLPRRKHWIVLDDSASIRCRKARTDLVWRLTALLGGTLLANGDPITIRIGENGRRTDLAPGNEAALIGELLRACDARTPGKALTYRFPAGYHVWVVSDFMDPAGLDHLEQLLRRARGFSPVRIYEEEERHPNLRTAVRLIDVESNRETTAVPDAASLRRYRERVDRFEKLLEVPALKCGTRGGAFDAAWSVPELIRAFARTFAPGGSR